MMKSIAKTIAPAYPALIVGLASALIAIPSLGQALPEEQFYSTLQPNDLYEAHSDVSNQCLADFLENIGLDSSAVCRSPAGQRSEDAESLEFDFTKS